MGDQGVGIAVGEGDQAGAVAGGGGMGLGRLRHERQRTDNQGLKPDQPHCRGLSSETWLGEA